MVPSPSLGFAMSGVMQNSKFKMQTRPASTRGVKTAAMFTPLRRIIWCWHFAFCILNFLAVASATAGERYAVIVSGASGGEKYAAQQKKWRDDLTAALRNTFIFSAANVVALT